jgi:helix-turn-helix protein
MNNYHEEVLTEIISKWDDAQLDNYISQQENRLEDIRRMIKSLKEILRKRKAKKKKPLDTGVRDGH